MENETANIDILNILSIYSSLQSLRNWNGFGKYDNATFIDFAVVQLITVLLPVQFSFVQL